MMCENECSYSSEYYNIIIIILSKYKITTLRPLQIVVNFFVGGSGHETKLKSLVVVIHNILPGLPISKRTYFAFISLKSCMLVHRHRSKVARGCGRPLN